MGLLLGGSVITVFELVDLILFHFIKTLFAPLSGGSTPEADENKPYPPDDPMRMRASSTGDSRSPFVVTDKDPDPYETYDNLQPTTRNIYSPK